MLPRRLAEAQQRLEGMLNHWGGWPLLRIDGGGDADGVLGQAERLIREFALALAFSITEFWKPSDLCSCKPCTRLRLGAA